MIDKAIERSSNTDSIVTVPVISLHEALDALRDRGETFDHVSVDGYEDVWDTNGEWRLRLTPDWSEIAQDSIESWGYDLISGFVGWCYDVRVETLEQLTAGDDTAVLRDLVYAANQRTMRYGFRLDDDRLREAFVTIINDRRSELVEALRQSLADSMVRYFTRRRRSVEITSEQIEDLRAEAKAYGDQEQVEICDRAIKGDEAALEECARVIDAAQARR